MTNPHEEKAGNILGGILILLLIGSWIFHYVHATSLINEIESANERAHFCQQRVEALERLLREERARRP